MSELTVPSDPAFIAVRKFHKQTTVDPLLWEADYDQARTGLQTYDSAYGYVISQTSCTLRAVGVRRKFDYPAIGRLGPPHAIRF